jgi:glycosyltransferase involved in cell wall biosynthesis
MILSIIIPTLNESKNIERVIQSIKNSISYNSKDIEIIVIDSPKTNDNTLELAKLNGAITDVIGPERSSQRNKGASLARGQFLYFVDADMEFSSNLLKCILENLNNENILVIPERVTGSSIYCKAINLEKQIYDNNQKISAARIMTKYAFVSINGYDNSMISGEDWDLSSRLIDSGKKIKFLKEVIFHHEEDLGFFTSIKKKIYYAKNLKNYKVAVEPEVNPIYRISVLFSKPTLIFSNIITFSYLFILKLTQFGVGFVVYNLNQYYEKT